LPANTVSDVGSLPPKVVPLGMENFVGGRQNQRSENQLNPSKTAFWDIDWTSLDSQADSAFIINRVFNYGTWADMLAVMRYYGLDRIRQEAVQGAYYKPTALSFLCLILGLNETDFTAYQRRQANRPIWNH
jgi:hypothetical protein